MKRVKLNEGQLRRLVREMIEIAGTGFGVRFAGMSAEQARAEAEDLKFRLARKADVEPSRWSWQGGPPTDDAPTSSRGGWMGFASLYPSGCRVSGHQPRLRPATRSRSALSRMKPVASP